MSERGAVVPNFVRGTRLSHDKSRDRWIVLAPEKVFVPDPVALSILELVDGVRSLGMIVDLLAQRYAAPLDVIANDVDAMIADLERRRVLCT